MFSNADQITHVLSCLGKRLEQMRVSEQVLVVCGGSALQIHDLVHRATKDVDVLGLVDRNTYGLQIQHQEIPREVLEAAEHVSKDLKLPDDWLNDSALALHKFGLPEGLLERAKLVSFGTCLRIYFVGRKDLIFLKAYAALNPKQGKRHLQDLVEINPSRKEMKEAANWLLDRKHSPEFANAVKSLCSILGS